MSNNVKVSLEVLDERPRFVSYAHRMDPAFRPYWTPWGNHQTGSSAGSFVAHVLKIVEPVNRTSAPGSNLQLLYGSAHSCGVDDFGNASSHTLNVRIYEVEPEMLEISAYPNYPELQEGVFPSGFERVPDCRWQIKAPLSGDGLVTVSLCPESAF